MTKTTKRSTKKLPIPTFSSYEQEANFWDTHDTTDYAFEPVRVKVAKPLGNIVSVRFETETLKKIDEQAESKGLGTASLIRMWTMERLNATTQPSLNTKTLGSPRIDKKGQGYLDTNPSSTTPLRGS